MIDIVIGNLCISEGRPRKPSLGSWLTSRRSRAEGAGVVLKERTGISPLDLLDKRLFSVFPKLVHFSSQTIQVRVNYGLSDSAFSEFDFKA